ncbi:MAG: hypothetical protein R3F23_02900 [Verrucomicrobiia bacterium]
MWQLTRKEQMVIIAIMSVFLVGAGVKAYRSSRSAIESNLSVSL